MKISEMLITIASWLENPNNEALLLADHSDECLSIVASSCLAAANELRKAASQVEDNVMTPTALDELAETSEAFDSSGDENLMRQASVIDELLISFAQSQSTREDYLDPSMIFDKKKSLNQDKLDAAAQVIEDSGATKNYRVLEAPLQTRGCPDHAGAPMSRVSENVFKCSMDGKIFDYNTGYVLENGKGVPGSSVSNQNVLEFRPEYSMFDNREDRMNSRADK